MTHFTMWNKSKLQTIMAVCFWLFIWHIASMWIGETIILVSPFVVVKTLFFMIFHMSFWQIVFASSARIIGGFLLALICGVVLAILSASYEVVRILIRPLMITVKSIPVASFIVLALLWLKSGQLAIFISFLMVLPIVYTNVLEGILSTDPQLLEMAKVFHIPIRRQMRYIFLPAVRPFLMSACTVGLGMCWKSGVAAEVIGITDGSIGGAIYHAKIFLSTAEVLVWTVVIVIVSLLFEKLFLQLLSRGIERVSIMSMQKMEQKDNNMDLQDIRISGLYKSYGETCVFQNWNGTFLQGERSCLRGPSGKGKTTLIRILMGLEHSYSGKLEGLEQKRFSCQFQENRLIEHLDGISNVRLADGSNTKDEIVEALSMLGFTQEEWRKPVRQLSGGQRRRVALVRAMLAQSDVVILDEPFKGLDEEVRKKAVDFVDQQQRGRTTIVVTHEEQDVKALHAKEVLV